MIAAAQKKNEMDLSKWGPLVHVVVAVAQLIVIPALVYSARSFEEKILNKIGKQHEKRFSSLRAELLQKIEEVDGKLADMRLDLNQKIGEISSRMSHVEGQQNVFEHLPELIEKLRERMDSRIEDISREMHGTLQRIIDELRRGGKDDDR